jgi:transposase
MRKLIVNAKHYFDQYKKNRRPLEGSASLLTSSILGISETTVKLIMAAYNKDGENGLQYSNAKNRGRPSFAITAGVEAEVRKFIRDGNKNGRQVILESICQHLKDIGICDEISLTTLWRTLLRWGFEFGVGIRSAQLKESERVIILRRRYLRSKLANRNLDGSTIRPEIYLDESYINKNHSRDDAWFFGEDDAILGKPTGKGERLIIVNAISEDGWVPNAEMVFKASKKTGDYHSSMNWTVFTTWFSEQLLPNIPKNSIIHLDNASYHNVLTAETFPKSNHTAQKLQEWLTHNDIPWGKDMLKAELFELCKRFAQKPEYQLDYIAATQGHSILRTPPYHPELQPIETCWAVVKGHVAAHNDFTMEKVWLLLAEGFQKVTAITTRGLMKKMRKQEDEFWLEDAKNECISESVNEISGDESDL